MAYIVNVDDIKKALLALGGEAQTNVIQTYIIENMCNGDVHASGYASERSLRMTIQRNIENHCPQAEDFDPHKYEPLFNRIARGLYQFVSVSQKITAEVSRGPLMGQPLTPHIYRDGKYIVSSSKFEEDYIRADDLEEAIALVMAGYKLRMSNPEIGHAPSLINPESISFGDTGTSETYTIETVLSRLAKEETLDKDGISTIRKEQALLRKKLVGTSSIGTCTLCEKTFPVNLLVAAHIKKRSKCNIEEKLDFTKIATLMCKFGCDELYEKGYVFVDKGILKKNMKMDSTTHMDELIKPLEERSISNWKDRAHYYNWHKKNVAKMK
jgi:hypothetical protein